MGLCTSFNKNRSCIEIYEDVKLAIAHKLFNKNRSCIEMKQQEQEEQEEQGLIKTEVVLKYVSTDYLLGRTEFNKNRSCIEIKMHQQIRQRQQEV